MSAMSAEKEQPSTYQILTSQIKDPIPWLRYPPTPTPKRWLEIFAQSFLWALTFFVIRRAFIPFDQESEIITAGNAALLGFAATFLRLLAFDMIWKNYLGNLYDDNLQLVEEEA